MKMKTIVLGMILSAALAITGYGEGQMMKISGDSLVLAGTNPGKLCFDQIEKGSVVIRASYFPGGTVYTENRDYTVDYREGTIARTPESRIPDYATHMLYGRKDFDHRKFPYPKCCNYQYFVWVDYRTDAGTSLAAPNDQSKYLSQTRKRLEAGGPFRIIGYGDSITPGCDVSDKNLIFTSLFVKYLKQKYPKTEIQYQDLSIPGYSSKEAVTWFDRKPENFHAQAMGNSGKADLVLIGFGMNDHNHGVTEPGKFRDNLVKLVKLTREKLGAEVILFSCFPPNNDWHYGSHRMGQYAAATRAAATQAHCAYVNVYEVWAKVLQRKDQSSLLVNNINHPNYFGHWLYEQAFEAMKF